MSLKSAQRLCPFYIFGSSSQFFKRPFTEINWNKKDCVQMN